MILHKLHCHPPADDSRGSLLAGQRDVVLRVQQTIHLGTACLEQHGHLFLGKLLLLHGLGKLPLHHLLDRLRLDFTEVPFLLEKVIKTGSHMLLDHRFNSL